MRFDEEELLYILLLEFEKKAQQHRTLVFGLSIESENSVIYSRFVISPDRTKVSPAHKIGSLSTRIFETRRETAIELFSLLICLHTLTLTLISNFTPLEMISIKITRETPLSWYAKYSLSVAARVSKTRVLKLPNTITPPPPPNNTQIHKISLPRVDVTFDF